MNRRKDIDDRKNEIVAWLKEGVSRAEVSKRIRCKYDTLKSRLDSWGVEFKNQSGKDFPKFGARVGPEKYLKNNGPVIGSARLKKLLFRDGFKEKRCEGCGITEWRGKPAPLELDHVSGDRFDNRMKNLQILCANCHAQQPTNAGKNKKRYTS